VTCGALPAGHETAIYRIVQEALTNIIKHAEAHTVSIVIAATDASARVLIEDDGVGFAVEQVRDGALGLVGMRERVALLSGRLDVQSAPGRGTTIMGELPLASSRP
jgi:signal transduction histidine kinase